MWCGACLKSLTAWKEDISFSLLTVWKDKYFSMFSWHTFTLMDGKGRKIDCHLLITPWHNPCIKSFFFLCLQKKDGKWKGVRKEKHGKFFCSFSFYLLLSRKKCTNTNKILQTHRIFFFLPFCLYVEEIIYGFILRTIFPSLFNWNVFLPRSLIFFFLKNCFIRSVKENAERVRQVDGNSIISMATKANYVLPTPQLSCSSIK